MKISVIGCGYVGCVTGACFADWGHEVVFVDIDPRKIKSIIAGKSPIYEPGLEDIIKKNQNRIGATMDLREAIQSTDLTFITVGTPSQEDGTIDLSYIVAACENLGQCLRDKDTFHTVIMKSTVLPGTTDKIIRPLLEKTSKKIAGNGFSIGTNPEFLREGNAVKDCLSPDRIIIGADDPRTAMLLQYLYAPVNAPVFVTTMTTAEMIKYASNAVLATKISLANEIGNFCKKLGIDSREVFSAVGMDSRINPAFFQTGIGFGGSCFPKDVRALIAGARLHGENLKILKAVLDVNEEQPKKLLFLLQRHIPNLQGKTIGVLGLSFKPDTDDIRESRAIPVIADLLAGGARVVAYDPVAMDNFRRIFPQIAYASRPDEVLTSDAVLIVTEWREFEKLDFHGKIVIDGRRNDKARAEAAIYEGVCW